MVEGKAPFDKAMPIVKGPEGYWQVKSYTDEGNSFEGNPLNVDEFEALIKAGQAFLYATDSFDVGLCFYILRYDAGGQRRSEAQRLAYNILHNACTMHKSVGSRFVEVFDVDQKKHVEAALVKASVDAAMFAARDGKWAEALDSARFAHCVKMDVDTVALYTVIQNRSPVFLTLVNNPLVEAYVLTCGECVRGNVEACIEALEADLGLCTEEEPGTRLKGQSVGYLCTLPLLHRVDHCAEYSAPVGGVDRTWPRS